MARFAKGNTGRPKKAKTEQRKELVSRETLTAEQQLAIRIGGFRHDFLGYVMYNFPWDDPAAGIQLVELEPEYKARFPGAIYGPDKWACELMDLISEETLKRGFDPLRPVAVDKLLLSVASGHGIGKSVFVALLVMWIMDTRPYCKITVTAGTADQLKTKTWAEVGKWYNLATTKIWFEYTDARGNMMLKRKGRKGDWYCAAIAWKKENADSFQGQHAANSSSVYIFDEASAIDDSIYVARDGGMTDGEPMAFNFGNPVRNSGRFFEETVGKLSYKFIVRQIDSRAVKITNKQDIEEKLRENGEDSDYFKVRVRGMFPSMGSVQFIPSGIVLQAMARQPTPDRAAPLIIGVDVARFGPDDTVIYPRIGRDAKSWPYRRFNSINTVVITTKVIEMLREFEGLGMRCSGLFIDATGGSIGGGVVDQLQALGWPAIGVQFGQTAIQNTKYRYRSDEMWGQLRDAINADLCLPDRESAQGSALFDQLTQREYGYLAGTERIWMETKKDMKDRGLPSPDIADALALTYAMDVAPLLLPAGGQARMGQTINGGDYDPHATI